MSRPTCASCWHYDGRLRLTTSTGAVAGYCRARPPSAAGLSAKWPLVAAANDYCAEHFEPATEGDAE